MDRFVAWAGARLADLAEQSLNFQVLRARARLDGSRRFLKHRFLESLTLAEIAMEEWMLVKRHGGKSCSTR